MTPISGYVCFRNAEELDYCWREAARSLIPVCQEVVLCIGTSTDGTRELAEQLAAEDARFRIVDYEWPNPYREIKWWVNFLNFAREQLRFPMQLTVDADEVLDPSAFDTIRQMANEGRCAWLHRINYWNDLKHTAPHGRVCGEQVVRLAPTDLWMCSDEPHPEGKPEYEIRTRAGWPPCAQPEMVIHHFGFLRDPSKFVHKIRAVNGAFFGCSDDRVERAHVEGVHWSTYVDLGLPLLDTPGIVPEVAHAWLKARGHL